MSDTSDRGFLLHVFQRNQGGDTAVFAVGRLQSGETFALADNRERPAFFVRVSDLDHLRGRASASGREVSVEETDWRTMDGEPVARVEARQLNVLRSFSEALHEDGIRTYEADVVFARQYLMNRGLRGSVRISGPWRQGTGVDRVYQNPDLQPDDWEPELSFVALDVETDPQASEIFAVSLVGSGPSGAGDVEEIHIVGLPNPNDPPRLFCHPGERELLEALTGRIRSIDPDILSGWNVLDFDLPVIQRRMKALGLPFNLGRSSDASWYREGDVWGGSRMVIYGRQVLDAMHLFRTIPQRFDDYRLETVAQAVLGRGKLAEPGPEETMPQFILRAYHQDRKAFCEYCLEDSRLVRDALEQAGLIQLSLRRSLLTGLPLERAWGSVAAFDFLYISELHRRRLVAPTSGVDRTDFGHVPGGMVMTAEVGLYRNIFVFDFKSLYPSIIRTFNIDPLSRIRASDGADDPILAPNGARFDRETGILPALLEDFFASRARARADGDELASLAYKIVMNSFYGVLGTDACRFAEGALAGAITEFGHYILRWAREQLESEDRGRVLYGDTDSLFVDARLADDIDVAEALERGDQLARWIDDRLAAHLEAEFGVISHLELEFEKFYRRFFLPPMRGSGDRARAKGYAGLKIDADGEEVEIIGMEAVRRDWTDLAHELQRDLIGRLFREAPAAEMETTVTEWIRAVRCGEKDVDLVYRKSLRKSISKYTSSSPPHVTAARMLPDPSGVIHYVITAAGPQPVGFVTAPLDYEHYVEKQIKPIVRTIGQVCDIDVEGAVMGTPDLFRSAGVKTR